MGLALLLGGEAILADRAIAELISQKPGAQVSSIDAAESEVGAITDALAPSLFGESRIVVIKELQDLTADQQDEVTSYLSDSDENVFLILWHKGGVKGKALLDKVKKLNPIVIACDVLKKEGEKLEFVQREFARLQRKITSGAVQDLVDALGSDLRELGSACSQLASDVLAGKVIDEGDVARYYQGRTETTGFEVADAVIDGRMDEALVSLRNALATGVDPVLIISALASSLRTLAKVSGASRGMKAFDLASSLGLPPWQIDKARRQLSGWNPDSLSRAVITVAQTDADIKGAAADPAYAMERCVIQITRFRGNK